MIIVTFTKLFVIRIVASNRSVSDNKLVIFLSDGCFPSAITFKSEGEREAQDYSIILYIVKKGDTLWNIAKEFGSTIDDIVRANGIEDPNVIMPGQKLFIPRYVKVSVSSRETPMISNA